MTNLSELSENSKKKTSCGGAWNFHIDHVENWAFVENVFTPEECQKIIEIGNSEEELLGDVVGQEKEVRKSFVSFLFPNTKTAWIFKKLTDATLLVNQKCFGFNINSFSEGLQFTRYYEPDGFYGAHVDKIVNNVVRKLSISIQLNESTEFDGGNLLLYTQSKPIKPEMKQGKLVAFPSYVLHEVTPVTRGTRYSLVAWISGPPFR